MTTTTALSGPEFLPPGKITRAVIFLHGLGSNGDDLMGLAPMMAEELPNTAFFGPHAPITVPFAFNGYQWFEYWDRTPAQMTDGIRQSAPLIADFIGAVAARLKIPASAIFLVGFSQGTMMALHTGLRLVTGLGGIVGFSGALVSPETLAAEKVKKMPPVLLIHGMNDPVVPVFASQQADVAINAAGGSAQFVARPMLMHNIDNAGIRAAADFIAENTN